MDYQGPKAGNRSGTPRCRKVCSLTIRKRRLESFILLRAAAQVIGDWEPKTGRFINQSKGWGLGLVSVDAISKRYGDMRHACLSIVCLAPNALARDLSPIKEKNYGNEKGICEKKRQNISKRNGED